MWAHLATNGQEIHGHVWAVSDVTVMVLILTALLVCKNSFFFATDEFYAVAFCR